MLVVKSRTEVEELVGEIREAKIMEQRTLAAMNRDVQQAQARYAPALTGLASEIEAKVRTVQAWAESHPDEFAKRKSIEFTHGTVGFRTGTPKLALLNRKWNWEKVLEAVRVMLPQFVRTKLEVDKEALIAQRDEVLAYPLADCGMKVVQEETFFLEANLEESSRTATMKTGVAA